MKVLLANKFFFMNGGSEAVLFAEREFLQRAGIGVVDFAMNDPRNRCSDYGEFFVAQQQYDDQHDHGASSRLRTAASLIYSREASNRIAQLIERTKPDLLHCHNIYHQLTPSIIRTAKRLGLPVVLTLHDYKVVCPTYLRLKHGKACSECIDAGSPRRVVANRCADGSLAKSALLYAEALTHRLLRSYESVDAFIAPSRFMRDSVTRGRLDASRVSVIPNGVDTNRIKPSEIDSGYALYMGRLSAEKGIETLLAAHARIEPRLRLIVAGTGRLEAELRQRYPAAEFVGYQTGSALDELVREASVVVVPSECYENCPMAVLEAMAHGKPVIASDIGGIPELVAPEETGMLFPVGDRERLTGHLARLMADPLLRLRLGRAGRARAERDYSQDVHNASLLRVYHNVIGKQTSNRA